MNEVTYKFRDDTKTIDLEWGVDGLGDVIKEFRDDELIPEDVTDAEAAEQMVLVSADGELIELFVNDSTYPKTLKFSDFAEALKVGDKLGDEGAVVSYIKWAGRWDKGGFHSSYHGRWLTFGEFAKEQAIDLGEVHGYAAFLPFVNWEEYAHSLLRMDYHFDESNGYVFRK